MILKSVVQSLSRDWFIQPSLASHQHDKTSHITNTCKLSEHTHSKSVHPSRASY